MRINYTMWALDHKVWKAVAESYDRSSLTFDLVPKTEFTHRDIDFIICEYKYENPHDETKPLTLTRIYCVTQSKGF